MSEARTARAAADRAARLPRAVGLAGAALVLLAWFSWRGLREAVVAGAAGMLLNEGLFRLLAARENLRLSLSAINHEEDLLPYFSHVGALAAIASAASVLVVFGAAWALRRDPGRLAVAALCGAGTLLLARVLLVDVHQGLLAVWTISDISEGFSAYVGLLRLRALGTCALFVPLLLLLNSRFSREG